MIVVDSSALVAIVLKEGPAAACLAVMQTNEDIAISAAVLTEVLVVAQSRGFESDVQFLIDNLGVRVVPVDGVTARQVMRAYGTWGKGNHPARLNLIDCFSYVLARNLACPLLFVGDDFSQTDIESAL